MARNRHPFEGDLARAKGKLRLWSGRGAGYSPYHKRKIPLDAMQVVWDSVPSVQAANKYIHRVERMGTHGGGVKRLTGTGFENSVFIEVSNTWWMLTGG